jgi:pilus assembly protein Flp/PilA
MQCLIRFLKSEDGPTAVEYAIMLALILLVIMVSVNQMQAKTGDVFNRCGTELDSAGF